MSGQRKSYGLDMSTDPTKTGFVVLTWDGYGAATVEEVINPRRSQIVERIAASRDDAESPCWAVDVPFGWPKSFGEWLVRHGEGPTSHATSGQAPRDIDDRTWSDLARRTTDRVILERLGSKSAGYSVSFDKLGSTAAAWAAIEAALAGPPHHVAIDRSGCDRFVVETWPSAAWQVFAGRSEVPAGNPATMAPGIFAQALDGVVDLKGAPQAMGSSGRAAHYRDAIVCALVARAVSLSPITDELPEEASGEGWIHVPEMALGDLVRG